MRPELSSPAPVAIVGMGCTRFGERWESSTDDLLLEAVGEALGSAGVARDDGDVSHRLGQVQLCLS